MSIADKLQIILENEQKVYNAGYEKGKNEGGGSAPAVLEELTITRNGVYEPGVKVELGGTYTFRNDYTEDELTEFRNNNVYCEIMGAEIWTDEFYTDSGEHCHLLWYVDYNLDIGYVYLSKNAIMLGASDLETNAEPGWYRRGTTERVDSLTITIPQNQEDIFSDLSVLTPLFEPSSDGFNKVNVNVEPELKELTVTKNGVYEAIPRIELGGTYAFKDSYTDDELKTLYKSGLVNADNGYSVFIEDYNNNLCLAIFALNDELYCLQYTSLIDQSWGYLYVTPSVAPAMGISNSGWVLAAFPEKAYTPTITIPADDSVISVDSNTLAPFFGLTICDGYNTIAVDIPLGELTITQNGTYEPTSNIELGGTYTFKDNYTDKELEHLFNLGEINGQHSYLIFGHAPSQLSIAKEEYNGKVSYGIYAPNGLYIGEQASEAYSNGVPGWYAYDASAPCKAPDITLPINKPSAIKVDLSVLELVFALFDGYNKITVNVPVGTDTSDATATEETILDGFSAYVNGEKVIGTKTFNLQEKTVKTKQSTVIPDEGYDGLSKVDINIEGELKITDNGTQDVTNYASVSVEVEKGVFPEGELVIKENGIHDVTSYASVDVSVSGGGGSNKAASIADGSITEITAEDLAGATRIGEYKFYGCSKLSNVNLPNSVTEIGREAFFECINLTSANIPDSVTLVGSRTFAMCSKLRSVTIGNGLPYIADEMFKGCNLDSINIPSNVTRISGYAFASCKLLSNVTIPNSVSSLGSGAFESCTKLASVTIGNGISQINNNAFARCTSLSNIILPDSTTNIGNSAFYRCGLTNITIPNTVTNIGSHAFGDCSSLTNVSFGSGIISIGTYAFSGCTSLTDIVIPDSMTNIGTYAFSGCKNLTSLTIGSGLSSIPQGMFQYCENLTNVTIPSNITIIGSSAFYSTYKLEYVDLMAYAAGISLPTLGHSNAFYNAGRDTTAGKFEIRVPTGRKADLASMARWSFYSANIVEI